MAAMLFTEPALAILREARWDPNAQRAYEIMSGGFQWSDERLGEVMHSMDHGDWDRTVGAVRFVLGYRSSLIRRARREELRAPWDQLLRECPHWPGFKLERVDPALAIELDREDQRTQLDFDELEQRLRRYKVE